MERILEKAYYDLDEPTSYGSVDRLAKSAGTSKEKHANGSSLKTLTRYIDPSNASSAADESMQNT